MTADEAYKALRALVRAAVPDAQIQLDIILLAIEYGRSSAIEAINAGSRSRKPRLGTANAVGSALPLADPLDEGLRQ